ncbi:perilipin-3-like isoform X2 [Aquila chrysaetos chrysaetos]|uniref:perilipin-3-like isoform X2 n=1 Tax=Aquila chrysaetos chrysaetos TaxID=223781 RepID=UPI001176C36F|nr:perilipin-3-like isoform X2 [Aquila chrysaetos chrysaetos]
MTQMTLISMSFAKGTSEERGYKLWTLFKKVKYAYCCFSISVQSLALTSFWRRAEVLPVSSSPSEENGLSHCKTHLYFRQTAVEFSMASEKTTKKDLLNAEEQQQASAVNRVTSLPLLNSAFNLVSSAYNYTKETHPYLSGVCSVAETVAAVAVGSVVGGAQPILNQLEPQIALVNEYACKGLDQLEENLPFLQQPADKVISDTRQLVSTKVTSAMDAACEAKEAMADKVTEAVGLTKNVVGDSVKLTRSMVTSTVNSAVEAAQGAKDLMTNKVTEAVDLTKHMVEDSIGLTKSAVASTIVNAAEAAQGAKDLVTNKVTEAVDLSKHIVEDSVGLTKSAVASTIVNAVEAAQGAKDLVTNKVTEAVDLSKHIVEDSVGLTKSAVASTITAAVGAAQGAKDLVTNTVTEAMDLTKGAVQDGVEKTKSVVTSTVNTALDAAYGTITSKINTALEQSREAIQEGVEKTNSVVTNSISKAKAVSQAVAGGVESVLGISEDLVDQYLPMTEEELGKLATTVEGFGMASVEEQKQQQSYFVRLGSLSNKVRHRAYQHSLNKVQRIKQSTQDTLSRLQLAIKLIESVKKEVGQKLLDGQEKLHQLWVDWSLTQPKGNQVKTASQAEVESRTLAMLRIITQQLQPVYENLKASIQGLPSNIQEAVYQATRNIHKLHSSFSSAMSFQDLSPTTLTQSQDCVAEARRSLDDLFEYVTQNTPLNWLVGPFRAIAKVSQDSRKQKKKALVTDIKSPMLEKAPLSKEVAKTPEEPKGANRILGEGCEVVEKLEEKAEKDTEVALAAKEIKTNAPEEDL